MGTLTYDSKLTATFDDRVLAHLQIVIWAKIRRGEPFSFTWTEPSRNGYGRKTPLINKNWVNALSKSANSPGGLQLIPEPEDVAP